MAFSTLYIALHIKQSSLSSPLVVWDAMITKLIKEYKTKMQLNHDTCCNDTKLNNTINHSN